MAPEHHDIYEKIGQNLKNLRRMQNVTQSKLAEVLGVSRVSIANIESGRHAIAIHHLVKASLFLGHSPHIFFEDMQKYNDISPIDKATKNKNYSDAQKNWINLIVKLD